MKTSRIVAAILTILLSLSLIASGGDKKPENSNNVGNNELYDQVMSRFTGELEKGSVVKVLENDTAIELGYVEELIAAFNEAYKDKGISAMSAPSGPGITMSILRDLMCQMRWHIVSSGLSET